MMLRLIAVLITLLASPAFSVIPGQRDAAFQDALQVWLSGDDAAALRALSDLANDDNRAAQIFLGQIEPLIFLHDHVTGNLTREERIELLRQPSGISGQSWLEVAREDTPLADAFARVRRIGEKADGIATLLEYGENAATLLPLISLANQRELAALEDLRENPYVTGVIQTYIEHVLGDPQTVGLMPKTQRGVSPSDDRLFADDAVLLESSILPNQTGVNAEIDSVVDQMAARPEYDPIRTLCEKSCADRTRCMAGIVATMQGEPAWIKLASPVETLLPTETYHGSRRIVNDLKRRIVMQPLYKSGWLENYDQCTYTAVQLR
ncbi:hypothetical protein [Pseudaestuariivita rosea]|uniref:hypothetical protein n=1 Tax=Pseudaestuariivita rosea TaxID=2763263 RepID=UPI001ABBBE8C|nr:hypothetical protein [Pseudaestuariivita rosea]